MSRSAHYVSGDYKQTSSVTAMLTKLQWSSLASRRLQNRLIMLYHICFDLVDIDWQQYLCKSTSSTPKTWKTLFSTQVPKCTNQMDSQSFFPKTVNDWYKLPADPADSPSLEAFKSLLGDVYSY